MYVVKNVKKSENKIKDLLIKNNFKFEQQYKPKWLKNKNGQQSLDFFMYEYNIAIEYQGLQHFKSILIFGGNDRYVNQIERDTRKYNKCKENEIKLFYFTDKKLIKSIPIDYIDKVYTNEEELIDEIKRLIRIKKGD